MYLITYKIQWSRNIPKKIQMENPIEFQISVIIISLGVKWTITFKNSKGKRCDKKKFNIKTI